MLVKFITPGLLREAAASINASIENLKPVGVKNHSYRFVIRPAEGCQYRRTSASYFQRGRRVHAICWHGHREFFRALFRLCPMAMVQTSLAKYTAQNFEYVFRRSDKNIGPPIAPVMMSQACDCPDSGRCN